jgi:signal transduction histidine kinase
MTRSDAVNILLVDDQPAKLMVYHTILGELGENLLSADSAASAFEHLLKNEIAVVLVDVCMPELDGYELAEMIRGHPRFARTAIIFVSAIAQTDLDRLRGYAVGAVDYLPVPVVPDLLRAKVKVFAELYRKTRQLEILNAELERRVEERTAELAETNAELELRVEQRTRERQQALAQVHEMQKLESLGKLTGGLAHDFNNVLMAVIANLEPLALRLDGQAGLKMLANTALRAAERGTNVTTRLLTFARRQELKPETLDTARMIQGMEDLLRRSLGPNIQVHMVFAASIGAIHIDPNQFELALLNLALNGRDAMPDGGHLDIEAGEKRIEDDEVYGLKAGTYVCISVTDSGIGMDAETLKRAPEPFFTTKEVGKGTGLGLSTVYGLAAQSGGAVRMRSQVGRFTTVEILLPIAEGSAVKRPTRGKTRVAPTRKALRIMVVDDDPLVLDGMVAILDELGHRPIPVASPARALELAEAKEEFDLVITDQAMPGMRGSELAQRLRKDRPDLRILIASGYTELPETIPAGMPRLDKPYRMDKLAAVIDSLMHKRRPRGGVNR